MSKDEVVQRKKRTPFGIARSKLAVDQVLEGYHLHWVNDTPGRVSQALAGDYTFVSPEEVGRGTGRDSKVVELVGTNDDGSPMQAYLMKIPMEFYLEDQEASQRPLDAIDTAIRGGRIINPGDTADGRYIPKEGISYKTK